MGKQRRVSRGEGGRNTAVRQEPAGAFEHDAEAGAVVGVEPDPPAPARPYPLGQRTAQLHGGYRVAHHVHAAEGIRRVMCEAFAYLPAPITHRNTLPLFVASQA